MKEFSEADAGLTIVASASHNTPETEAFIAKVFREGGRMGGGALDVGGAARWLWMLLLDD